MPRLPLLAVPLDDKTWHVLEQRVSAGPGLAVEDERVPGADRRLQADAVGVPVGQRFIAGDGHVADPLADGAVAA